MGSGERDRSNERVTTGVPGLDQILHGGLIARGIYMLQGRPGAGKTILANQIGFHHAAGGGSVLYVTLLAESHERLLYNLQTLSYFDASKIPSQISYVSAFSTLEERGLDGTIELLRREARARKATLLVVDGLITVEESAATKTQFKKFIHDLQIHANLVGCTVLLLTGVEADPVGPEHTMVDGVITLSDVRWGRRAERELEVKKFRGSGYLRGGHAFRITDDGIVLYPRLEGLLQEPSRTDSCKIDRVRTGIGGLDPMLHGGLPCASTTLLVGPSGTGKTTVGLHFLNESSEEEPGLLFGFYETPERILFKGQALGLELDEKCKAGTLDIRWNPPTERILDALGNELIDTIRSRGVKRLFVDGLDGFLKSASHPERISHFVAALTNELRVLGVTAIYTSELAVFFGREVEVGIEGISSLAENVVLLRFVELDDRVHRMLTIMKIRDSDYDSALRELVITGHGAHLADTFRGMKDVATGMPKKAAGARAKPQKRKRRS